MSTAATPTVFEQRYIEQSPTEQSGHPERHASRRRSRVPSGDPCQGTRTRELARLEGIANGLTPDEVGNRLIRPGDRVVLHPAKRLLPGTASGHRVDAPYRHEGGCDWELQDLDSLDLQSPQQEPPVLVASVAAGPADLRCQIRGAAATSTSGAFVDPPLAACCERASPREVCHHRIDRRGWDRRACPSPRRPGSHALQECDSVRHVEAT